MNVSFFRKCLVLTVVFLFVGTSIIPSTGFGTDVSNDPFLGNVDIDPTVELTVNDPVIVFGSIQIDENTFTTLEIPNNGFTIIEGEAKLPLIRHMVEIPQNATPEIVVTSVFWNHVSLDEMDLSIKIVPVQPSVIKTAPEPDFIIDDNYYSKSEFMQTDIARIVETGEIRGHRFALIEISPVQYKPSEGELKIMTSCDIIIDFLGSDIIGTEEKYIKYYSETFENLFNTLFINHESQGYGALGTSKNQEGYLVVTNDTLYNEMVPFISWKEDIGFNVTTVNTSSIPGGPTTNNIHDYIQDAYDNWSTPPSHVLLVGDTSQIPTFSGTTAPPYTAQAVDLYYVTVDGSDYFPDIRIGRFPASNEADVAAMVNKVIFYEKGNFSSNDWIKKAAFMAGNANYQLTEGTHNYVINNFLDPNNYTCDRLYEVTYGASTQDVRDALNDGRSLAIYSGHGSYYSWVDGPQFTQSDVRGLTNQNMYSFVCSHACKTGTFNLGECFGETWVREPNKAALAFWGASGNTFWNEDDILERETFRAWWNDSIETIGGMTDMGLYYLYQNYSGGGYSKYYFEVYNVLGDPSVKIWHDEPHLYTPSEISDVHATPEHQNIGGEVNITCNVTDDLGVDLVKVNITYPNGTIVNQTMACISSGSSDTDLYYYCSNYSNMGVYSFFIWVNDAQGNQNISQNYTFKIGTILNVTDLALSWNLISLTFNQSINKTELIVNWNGTDYSWYDAINASIINEYLFGWNQMGQSYIFTDTLQPGNGYWIYAYDYCKLEVFTMNISYDNYISNLSSYWNIIGIPSNCSINKTDIIIEYNASEYNWSDAVLEGLISEYTFGWSRTLHSYKFSNAFEPGYAYWLYAYFPCLLKQ